MSRYHKSLRVSVLIVLLVLVFDAGYLSPVSKQLSDTTIAYLANSVGVFARVEENELNTVTAALQEREAMLDERETILKEREIATRDFSGDTTADFSTYILSTILFMLTVLIVLNYALDFARARKIYEQRFS